MTKIREIERTLENMPATATCKAPELIDTSRYNPFTGLNSSDDGSVRDKSTDTEIPNVGKVSYFKDTEGNIFGTLEPVPQG